MFFLFAWLKLGKRASGNKNTDISQNKGNQNIAKFCAQSPLGSGGGEEGRLHTVYGTGGEASPTILDEKVSL